MKVELDINRQKHTVEVEPRLSLLDCLRDKLLLIGAHAGCEHGVCGACTVLCDGLSVRACLMLAVLAHGHEIVTIEGLAPDAQSMHPLQTAFSSHHALQCGFCTPGILMTLVEFLRENPAPTDEEVRVALSGNLCRCTGYQGIVAAALDAAQRLRAAGQA